MEYYAGFFNVVEINSSFYRPPNAAMARGWFKKTAPDFIFAVKAWQEFTHPTRLGEGTAGTGERWPPFDHSDIARFIDGI